MSAYVRWGLRSNGWMGKRRGSGEAGKRGSPLASQDLQSRSDRTVAEVPVAGPIPRHEVPGWRDRFGVTAGITGRGFDLGLWSSQPVGEVMNRWLAFRREMNQFHVIALGNQVHGAELMRLDAGRGWIYMDGIDGWISTTPGVLLTVTVADCVPVYVVAPRRGVALLHAGWRGIARGILGKGVEQLKGATGASLDDLVIHCGIGICGDCYEVGSEVLQGCGVAAVGAGPWHLDLRSRLVEMAQELGIREITTSSLCSAHDNGSFYSHRASRGQDGRMVAYLGIAPLASKPLHE
jgi:YfiH family protein